MKYDSSIIDAEIKLERRAKFYDRLSIIMWALYPLGCLLFEILFVIAFAIGGAYVLANWLCGASLNGTY